MVRTLAVTAANESFAPLLRGLVGSLRQWPKTPITDLACFDLGLEKDSRRWIASEARAVVKPGWDLPVDRRIRAERPEHRALTVRPYLRDYFPGYDVYFWLDADLWVQQKASLGAYVKGARKSGLAVAVQDHPAYVHQDSLVRQREAHLRAYYGGLADRPLLTKRYFNPGVFAMAANAPHWESWAKWLRSGIENTQGRLVNDQTAINHAIWTDRLPVAALPALSNWCCHLAAPHFDPARGRLVEPGGRGRPIGIVHLTAHTKGDPSLHFNPARAGRAKRSPAKGQAA